MGLLDDMFSKKKEALKTGTKANIPKKDTGKKVSARSATSQSGSSIFGSLRRGQGGVTATGKNATVAPNCNDLGKTKASLRDKPPDKDKKPWFRSANNILKKEVIKPSVASLTANGVQKSANGADLKKKRPISVSSVVPSNVTLRRGQNPKIDGQNLPDSLSRTSSITNLDAEQKVNKGAKPRKSASRDRIDKIGDVKKNDKKVLTKNNNKLDSGDSPYPSIDSLQEEEFIQLRRQLQEMAQEKSNLALQLGEQKGQLNILQKEIQKLKEESNLQLEHLTEENTALRNRLRDVAHSPLSDNEKQQLLYESHRHHSSAPASIATNLAEEGNGGDITACPTPDWDKHSSSNVSEISVACLQDKINQMQETHYSTNEELQATLQELTDLQRQLTELQQENERLNEEKTLMFDSLCRQTERLNDSRSEVESLKQLLYREKDETGQYESAVEREQKLLDLLKSSQEEREALIGKLEQINNEIQEARAGILEKDERIIQLSERVRTLESTLDAKHAEHKLLDQELAQAKDQCSARQIEINRLTDLLDNARTKITELEQDRALSDKSELDELLDNARKEKDALESEVAHLKEQLAIGKNEIEKLKEQVLVLQEECKVTRNNARTTQSDLEYKCEKLVKEKNALSDQLQEFQEAVNELQVQSQCQLEDKRQLSAVLSETQRNLSEAERKNLSLDNELHELKKLRTEENEEWEKFQNDLLTSVRVANDFKTEAQQELQRMILENKTYRERERQLKTEIDKLKGELSGTNSSRSKTSDKEDTQERDMEGLFKLSRKSKDKPKKSKDAADTNSSGSGNERTKEKKPDVLTKMVKRREKKPGRAKKDKSLSVEEEILMKSLNDWYENIDKSLPEEKLTEEERVVKKLKTLYEDECIREKPIAHKPKDQLAISKPLLDSVFLNPKLQEIARNPNVPTIEEIGQSEILSNTDSPDLRNVPDRFNKEDRVKSDNFGVVEKEKRISIIGRSKSLDDLYSLEETEDGNILYRSNETDDLRNETVLKQAKRESSILPSDSVSNPRYSDFTLVVNSETNENSSQHAKVTRKGSVSYETLQGILDSIPNNTSESQLTNEQQFALRFKKALDEAERKNTLKKHKTDRNVIISAPLIESVKNNPRLREILSNPHMQAVGKRRNSESEVKNPVFAETTRLSKSYQDICFTFEAELNKNTSTTENISSCDSTASAEFNIEASLPECDRDENSTSVEVALRKVTDDIKVLEDEEFDSLTYNETLGNRRNSKNRHSKVNQPRTEDFDLLYNETLKRCSNEYPTKIDQNRIVGDQNLLNTETQKEEIKRISNTDKDLNRGEIITEDKVDYQRVIDLPSNISVNQIDLGYHEPLTKRGEFDEVGDTSYLKNDKDKQSSDIGDDSRQIELTVIETLNKQVRLPETETYNQNQVTNQDTPIEITKEIIFTENIIHIPEDISVDVFGDHNEEDQLHFHKYEAEPCVPRINDNFSKCHINISTDIGNNESAEENEDYDYHSILKENRYGVISPLNVRLVYKDVVREIKETFPHSENEIIKEDSSEGECEDLINHDTFFDEFFGVKRKPLDTENGDAKGVSNSLVDIDKEMEEIFEKYLHTPLSKVITRIDETNTHKQGILESPEHFEKEESSMKQNSRDKDYLSINRDMEEIDDPSPTIESPTLSTADNQVRNSIENRDGKDDNCEDSLEEIVLIIDDSNEEKILNSDKTENSDSAEEIKNYKLSEEVDLTPDEGSELTIKTSVIESDETINKSKELTAFDSVLGTQLPVVSESFNENVDYSDNDNNNENSNKNFTAEELNLLRSIRQERFSRPLSDFGEKDLQLIEAISMRYIYSEHPEENENIAEQNESVTKDELPEYLKQEDADYSYNLQYNEVIDQEVSKPPKEENTKKVNTTVVIERDDVDEALLKMLTPNRISVRHKRAQVKNFDTEKKRESHDDEPENSNKNKENVQTLSSYDQLLLGTISHQSDDHDHTNNEKDHTNNKNIHEADEPKASDDGTVSHQSVHHDEKDHTNNENIHTPKTTDEVEFNIKTMPDIVSEEDLPFFTATEEDDDVHTCLTTPVVIEDTYLKVEINNPAQNTCSYTADEVFCLPFSENQNHAIVVEEPILSIVTQSADFSVNDNKDEKKNLILEKKCFPLETKAKDGEYERHLNAGVSTEGDKKNTPIFDVIEQNMNEISENDVDPKLTSSTDDNSRSAVDLKIGSLDSAETKLGIVEKRDGILVSPKVFSPTADDKTRSSIDLKIESLRSAGAKFRIVDNRDGILEKGVNPKVISSTDDKSRSSVDLKIGSLGSSGAKLETLKRNHYRGVKERLQFFSRNDELLRTGRQSLRSTSGRTESDERKVQSWAEQFEHRSLDDTYSYEPVYANFSSLAASRNTTAKAKIEKKPLPIPRMRSQSRPSSVVLCDSPESVKDDAYLKEIKMNDPENFSENVAKGILHEVESNVLDRVCNNSPSVRPNFLEMYEAPKVSLGAKMVENQKRIGHTVGIKKSEKFLDVPSDDDIKIEEDDDAQINVASRAGSSPSTIAIAGKFEQLDITKDSENNVEEEDNYDTSKVNFFQLDTPSFDSYVNLFKQPEEKVYDDLTNQKKAHRGYVNLTYLGEISDNESFDDMLYNKVDNAAHSEVNDPKPKVIDFVPLDHSTKPFFNKSNLNVPDYNTKEQEKLKSLSRASSNVRAQRSIPKMEGSTGSVSSDSSFSAAKKVFEALLQANSNKRPERTGSRKKDSVYELKEKIEMNRSSSSMGLVDKRKAEEDLKE